MFYPELNEPLLSTDKILYGFQHVNEYKVPDSPENDGAHIHSYYEIYVNFSGDVSFLVNNHIYKIKKGDIIFTRPEDVHFCIFNNPCYHDHFCLWLDAPSTSPLTSFTHEPGFPNHISPPDDLKEEFLLLISHLTGSHPETNSKLAEITTLFEMMRFLEKQSTAVNVFSHMPLPQEMQEILDYLSDNFTQIQHINVIYDLFFVSPSTLTRWFRKYIRLSPKEFLESKKLAYAKNLLKNGYSVTETCMLSGFSSTSYFISVFKKKFGVTPLSYKQNIQIHD